MQVHYNVRQRFVSLTVLVRVFLARICNLGVQIWNFVYDAQFLPYGTMVPLHAPVIQCDYSRMMGVIGDRTRESPKNYNNIFNYSDYVTTTTLTTVVHAILHAKHPFCFCISNHYTQASCHSWKLGESISWKVNKICVGVTSGACLLGLQNYILLAVSTQRTKRKYII
jgi:hypothetical protein